MREEIIAQIRAVQAELDGLGVKRESCNFRWMSDGDLRELLESIGEQLATRKRFLGETQSYAQTRN